MAFVGFCLGYFRNSTQSSARGFTSDRNRPSTPSIKLTLSHHSNHSHDTRNKSQSPSHVPGTAITERTCTSSSSRQSSQTMTCCRRGRCCKATVRCQNLISSTECSSFGDLIGLAGSRRSWIWTRSRMEGRFESFSSISPNSRMCFKQDIRSVQVTLGRHNQSKYDPKILSSPVATLLTVCADRSSQKLDQRPGTLRWSDLPEPIVGDQTHIQRKMLDIPRQDNLLNILAQNEHTYVYVPTHPPFPLDQPI